jgi:hypothetical protein
MAIDVSNIDIRHIRKDKQGRYLGDMNTGLHHCLAHMSNDDQTAQDLFLDLALTIFTYGDAAIVPVETDLNPEMSGGWDVKQLRVGRITQWFADDVELEVYNQLSGIKEQVMLAKKFVAIVHNPLFYIMNSQNGTLTRLAEKLALLDAADKNAAAGKLDLIIQLPYIVKSDIRKEQAKERLASIEEQLATSKYGIAYIDGTEKATQLNRAVENTLPAQVESLTKQLYSELGFTEEILNGTANSQAIRNYFNRTIRPIVRRITEVLTEHFLTKTARSQGQEIRYFKDPFEDLTPLDMATVMSQYSQMAVLTSNEIRDRLGYWPVADPVAEGVGNKNIIPQMSGSAEQNQDIPEPAGSGETE